MQLSVHGQMRNKLPMFPPVTEREHQSSTLTEQIRSLYHIIHYNDITRRLSLDLSNPSFPT